MTQRPVAGYYRISVAREDMKAPELYSGTVLHSGSWQVPDGLGQGPAIQSHRPFPAGSR